MTLSRILTRTLQFSPRGYAGSVVSDARVSLRRFFHDGAAIVALVVLVLPWVSLFLLRSTLDWLWEIGGIAAVVVLIWWMSRAGMTSPSEIRRPALESIFAIALVALWMVWRVGICSKSFFFLPAGFDCYKSTDFEILPKVVELAVFPVAALFAAGYSLKALGVGIDLRAWWISIPAILLMIGYAVYMRHGDVAGLAQSGVEFFFAAGLPEEIAFRAILLTRLEAWWKNPAWALFGASAIFGLSHLPIDYLFFTSHNWTETWIAALTFQMGFGAALGFAYQRTRNIWPLVVLHALVDAA
ncbi:MAG: CPBP family intramembrane metalloprotease [Chloroflexi bacterium]|nr:CPBP family intramembrane metalloprotease [Chloroflexota bacterium]